MFDSQRDEDTFWWIILVPIVIVSGALLPLLETVRVWLVEHKILVDDNVLIQLPGGSGFDLPRVLLIATVLLIAVLVLIRVATYQYKKSRRARIIQGDDE